MTFRGHETVYVNGEWLYNDDLTPTYNEETGKHIERPCAKCGLVATDDVDPCLGKLPGVKYACCGHGDPNQAYIMFEDGLVVRHFDKIDTYWLEDGDERKI